MNVKCELWKDTRWWRAWIGRTHRTCKEWQVYISNWRYNTRLDNEGRMIETTDHLKLTPLTAMVEVGEGVWGNPRTKRRRTEGWRLWNSGKCMNVREGNWSVMFDQLNLRTTLKKKKQRERERAEWEWVRDLNSWALLCSPIHFIVLFTFAVHTSQSYLFSVFF